MDIRKITATLAITAAFILGGVASIPSVMAHNNNHNSDNNRYNGNSSRSWWGDKHYKYKDNSDVITRELYRDGSVDCTGADDTRRDGGRVSLFPGNNEVHFKITLKNASPNSTYTVAISQEPDCANAQFYTDAITTNNRGNAVFYGTYDNNEAGVPEGEHNLLVNMVTVTPDKAKNREIATKNARIEVPAAVSEEL